MVVVSSAVDVSGLVGNSEDDLVVTERSDGGSVVATTEMVVKSSGKASAVAAVGVTMSDTSSGKGSAVVVEAVGWVSRRSAKVSIVDNTVLSGMTSSLCDGLEGDVFPISPGHRTL